MSTSLFTSMSCARAEVILATKIWLEDTICHVGNSFRTCGIAAHMNPFSCNLPCSIFKFRL